jgi:hypothetical protein
MEIKHPAITPGVIRVHRKILEKENFRNKKENRKILEKDYKKKKIGNF